MVEIRARKQPHFALSSFTRSTLCGTLPRERATDPTHTMSVKVTLAQLQTDNMPYESVVLVAKQVYKNN